MNLTIDITDTTGRGLNESLGGIVRAAAAAVLEIEGRGGGEIGLAFVDDGDIREMNRRFRRIDAPTDVLSFPSGEDGYLGDIVISVERAAEQAHEFGHGIRREIAFLTAHSVLHLLGYDHETAEDARGMLARQESALQKAGFGRQEDRR
ncbi:MAG: rRNA maturation RNase YbeY [Clostridiales bacterium]|jgi:probable rRNA maturation factor|nr:rRNA maturation RNase YbeY [Clostridiales bacterium]